MFHPDHPRGWYVAFRFGARREILSVNCKVPGGVESDVSSSFCHYSLFPESQCARIWPGHGTGLRHKIYSKIKMDGYIRTKLTKEINDAEDRHIAVFKQIGKELNLPDLDIKSIEYGRRYYYGDKYCLRTWNWEQFDAKLNQIRYP